MKRWPKNSNFFIFNKNELSSLLTKTYNLLYSWSIVINFSSEEDFLLRSVIYAQIASRQVSGHVHRLSDLAALVSYFCANGLGLIGISIFLGRQSPPLFARVLGTPLALHCKNMLSSSIDTIRTNICSVWWPVTNKYKYLLTILIRSSCTIILYRRLRRQYLPADRNSPFRENFSAI